jgi:hypothetical protein
MSMKIDKTARREGFHKMPVAGKPPAIKTSIGKMPNPVKVMPMPKMPQPKAPSIKYGSFPAGHVY